MIGKEYKTCSLFLSVLLMICVSAFENTVVMAQSGNRILIIGDSNAARRDGWADQLISLRPSDRIINTAVSGNTVGFDNLGRKNLNSLKMLNKYLKLSDSLMGGFDIVIIMLGTNDCKTVFRDSLYLVPQNMMELIGRIRTCSLSEDTTISLFLVSPPPYGRDELLAEKYIGGKMRIEWLIQEYRRIAEETGSIYVDVYTPLFPRWDELSEDGIHAVAEGQKIIAIIIDDALKVNQHFNVHGPE